ncbi:PRC-barrel domain-containing protein [Azospirillum sp. INR13]|uniref:PRC-barrel domain-containing protein n=1 Tax=Azospirillum sp. INR13 TaxID=2596919 RepID=UPI001892768C|nr:PRC-barrel domain-containing protein [Azospirillum sp. INR13]
MNKPIFGAISAVALMVGTAWAQAPAGQNAAGTTQARPDATVGQTPARAAADETAADTAGVASTSVASVDKLMGKDVVGKDGDKLGEVEDVILDGNGQAQQLVLSRGGLLGINEKKIAIDFAQVQSRPDDDKLHVSTLSEGDVRNLPEFKYEDGMTSLNRQHSGDGTGVR